MRRTKLNLWRIGVFALIAAAAVACKKDDPEEPSNSGKMTVKMTDSPAEIESMVITVTKTEMYHASQGWVEISSSPKSVDVCTLTNGTTTTLGTKTGIATGSYTKVRLTFENQGSVQYVGASASVNAGFQSNTTVEEAISFSFTGSSDQELLLDFDVKSSLIEAGGLVYIHPVIRVIVNKETGIKGDVVTTLNTFVTASNSSGPVASAYADSQGRFKILDLAAGSYTVFIEADSAGTVNDTSKTFTGVMVVSGEITDMGTIQF